ncbi:MAG: asparagine synthase (glutamine-hydrolyzing) [Planctomycetaceae bacterium]
MSVTNLIHCPLCKDPMCGIAGFLTQTQRFSSGELDEIALRMAMTLDHRGPDDRGTWVDAAAGIGLGQTRLSIVDLSPTGHQPMISRDERYVLVYNGEIYSHPEMRAELEQQGVQFRGHSDTEILLEAVATWGIEEAIRRSNGMFAFALWDRKERKLTLVRDRLGIKPLYYGVCNGTLLFGSELKALKTHPHFIGEIDRSALCLYLKHNDIPAPHSIYRQIHKLPAGSWLTISPEQLNNLDTPKRYWDLAAYVREKRSDRSRRIGGEQHDRIEVDRLETLLKDAVQKRMIADVPLGAFLSGGIDSSLVVSLMQSVSKSPVKTFSIGYAETKYNEADAARAVARHLGTDHTEWIVTPKEARDVIPRLPQMFDEPFGDSSQIPTWLVSQLARRSVTVSLSGDGGDELCGGYDRYGYMTRLWKQWGWLPGPMRRFVASGIRTMFPRHKPGVMRRKANTLADFLELADRSDMYDLLNSHWKYPEQIVIAHDQPLNVPRFAELTGTNVDECCDSFLEEMMLTDTLTYLPDDILVKVDRASMSVGLEARVPLLDYRVVEHLWSLPLDLKVRDGQTKWILRQVLDRYVPRALFDRPKTGFGIPIDDWLRGPLKEWAEELLSEERLKREGYFHPQPIRDKWQRHLSGTESWHYYLWDILMFQAWLEHQSS